jgi:hypothetical protein
LAISEFAAIPVGKTLSLPPEIMRFLAWQAARTPGWMELEQRWVDDPPFDPKAELLEPPLLVLRRSVIDSARYA